MVSKQTKSLSIQQVHERWRDQIQWIIEEADFEAGHRIRYRLIKKWLFRPNSRRWFNRHFQAFGWISRLWLNEGLMSVRRQLDNQHGSVSLRHLLREIENQPEVLPILKTSEVVEDRKNLENECQGALQFAHRQLAHRVPWDDPFVSISMLDATLDSIEQTANKYYIAITGNEFKPETREPDPYWLQSFEVAWKKPRKRKPRTLSDREFDKP